ncbi:cytochrome c oxidase subunit 3 [Sulfuriflexus mobilis]|uniref:cytochrome c oxidase subunit 3 n=1 Tax=Sulfuriflexus mobilis TaxID=1811807 RepID=UPI000F81CAFB|nr:cytochrome c oxidase subunit 3 [Sulfuriflexus mobilis]
MSHASGGYYLPEPSKWPIIGSIGLFLTLFGFASALPHNTTGAVGDLTIMYIGMAILVYMLFGWFGQVIGESEAGVYDAQVDRSFRMGMMWFIFSEVMFFAAFFGALFYVRTLALPWLGGADNNAATNEFLWNGFVPSWPLNVMPNPEGYSAYKEIIGAWGIPALNTAILLTSGVTITLAHWALKKANRGALIFWLLATVVLGFVFVGFQVAEYGHAYGELNLKLSSGIYGSTFFMLTGFHGLHVTIGAIMLTVMLFRAIKGHFTEENHFAFEAAAWYWHFVDVVWLGLFIFVYWL